MKNVRKIWVSAVILVLIISIFVIIQKNIVNLEGGRIKIGVITPMTGAVAYWGESTAVGVALARIDLAKEGIKVDFIIEDGQLDPKVALSAAQKLVNIDKVSAIYSEFNPAAIAVSSFLKDKDILNVYDAAPVSPLKEGDNVYKTYLDYEIGCMEVAQLLKNKGFERVGVLKVNLEFGDLCLKGIKEVYGNSLIVEDYNAGASDFRSSLSKLKAKDVQVLFNVAFQPETLASLKQAKELGMKPVFAGLSETVSPDVIGEYSNLLEGSFMFGLPAVSEEFIVRVEQDFPGKVVNNYQAVALAYIHLKQMAGAINKCGNNLVCVRKEMDSSRPENLVGFTGFKNHIAGLNILIQKWEDGQFVSVE